MATRKAYVVQQLNWEYNDNWHDIQDDNPVRAFTDRDKGEIHCIELEERERESRGFPFGIVRVLAHATSLSEDELVARMTEMEAQPNQQASEGIHSQWDFMDYDW